MKTHFGDPCIHCGVPHDDVPSGPCTGTSPPVPVAFATISVRWDGVEHFRVRYSDGHIEDRWDHASMNAPYYHFGAKQFGSPPEYDPKLKEG